METSWSKWSENFFAPPKLSPSRYVFVHTCFNSENSPSGRPATLQEAVSLNGDPFKWLSRSWMANSSWIHKVPGSMLILIVSERTVSRHLRFSDLAPEWSDRTIYQVKGPVFWLESNNVNKSDPVGARRDYPISSLHILGMWPQAPLLNYSQTVRGPYRN